MVMIFSEKKKRGYFTAAAAAVISLVCGPFAELILTCFCPFPAGSGDNHLHAAPRTRRQQKHRRRTTIDISVPVLGSAGVGGGGAGGGGGQRQFVSQSGCWWPQRSRAADLGISEQEGGTPGSVRVRLMFRNICLSSRFWETGRKYGPDMTDGYRPDRSREKIHNVKRRPLSSGEGSG